MRSGGDAARRRRARVAPGRRRRVQGMGGWPDLRLRGSLLGSEHLVRRWIGRRDRSAIAAAQAAVRRDRGAALPRRGVARLERLIVTAVRSEGRVSAISTSSTFRRMGPSARSTGSDALTLVGTVGALRRSAAEVPAPGATRGGRGGGPRRMHVATPSPWPAAEPSRPRRPPPLVWRGVQGADPDGWRALELTGHPGSRPRSSAVQSSLVEFGHCQVRWLLGATRRRRPSIGFRPVTVGARSSMRCWPSAMTPTPTSFGCAWVIGGPVRPGRRLDRPRQARGRRGDARAGRRLFRRGAPGRMGADRRR